MNAERKWVSCMTRSLTGSTQAAHDLTCSEEELGRLRKHGSQLKNCEI
jgi:hypothetical protein